MKRTLSRLPVALSVIVATAACDDSVGPVNETLECTTNVAAAQGDTFVELCALDAPVRHVRLENVKAPATHASAQIVFGFDAPPASPSEDMSTGQFRVLLYGGGFPFPPPQFEASFGEATVSLGDEDRSFINDGTTVCFDIHDGSATTAPAFVIWVDGVKGADCDSKATLTAATAYSAVTEWGGMVGAIDKAAKVYFRQSAAGGTTPTVRLFAEPVLEAAEIEAATTCTTTWAANTNWQQLCAPAAGSARHIRIQSARSTANNSYFYAVIGQDPSPTGNPATGVGKLILTGGRSNSGSSWTWLRFGTGSTGQFSFTTDAGAALYTDGPSDICFDLGEDGAGNARVIFWATGAKAAHCGDRATLTVGSALYDSTTDAVTGALWNGPFVSGKLNFIKTNSDAASVGDVTLSSEAAVL